MKNTINAADIQVQRVKHDVNGKPRYIVSFKALGLPTGESTAKTRAAGLKKYRGKDFNGFVFTSYYTEHDLERILEKLHG